ncbi:sensor domain CHASE-containing protein [Labrenzia sp. EL_126]|nr:sensor domain CHASE-containing protein [Labrenzia sp. EL_126]
MGSVAKFVLIIMLIPFAAVIVGFVFIMITAFFTQ